MFRPKNYSKKTELACGLTRTERTVDTPMPETEEGSGYETEINHSWCYHNPNEHFKVIKVSDNGWTVSRYAEEDGEEIIMRRLGHGLNAQEAQRLAMTKALKRRN